jgi:hypothetical protein
VKRAPTRFLECTRRAAPSAKPGFGEEASALLELAHFPDTVRDAPAEAELLFAEAARRASWLLEEAWAGWISGWATRQCAAR